MSGFGYKSVTEIKKNRIIDKNKNNDYMRLHMSEKHPSTELRKQRAKLVKHIAGIKKNTAPGATKNLGVSAGQRLLAELDRKIRGKAQG